MTMARNAQRPVVVINKAQAAREFHLTWDQIDYLFRKYQLKPIPMRFADQRAKWFRRDDVLRLLQVAPLKRAS